jgi:hypothetical protein
LPREGRSLKVKLIKGKNKGTTKKRLEYLGKINCLSLKHEGKEKH